MAGGKANIPSPGQAVSGILAVQENERRRIARNLGERLLEPLIVADLKLQLWKRSLRGEDLERLKEIRATLSALLGGLRHLMADMQPLPPGPGRLAASLRSCLDTLSGLTGCRSHLENHLTDEPPEPQRALCRRIVQEALGNVQLHAGADLVGVTLEERDGGLFCSVCDNGRGFDPAAPAPTGALGLSVMREWAELADGWLRVETAPGKGTTLSVWLPTGGRQR